MRRAKEQLPDEQRTLIADVELFIRQEANHYQHHQRYKHTLYGAGYTALREYEAQQKAD